MFNVTPVSQCSIRRRRVDHARTVRSYSVASAPRADGSLRLLVTLVPGGSLSGWVHRELQPGSPVLLSGSYGSFLDSEPDQMPVLYLAGGSGIAPVHALAEATLQSGSQRPATLFFSARTAADVIDRERYAALAKAHPNFQFMWTLTRAAGQPHGRTPAILADWFPDLHLYLLARRAAGEAEEPLSHD